MNYRIVKITEYSDFKVKTSYEVHKKWLFWWFKVSTNDTAKQARANIEGFKSLREIRKKNRLNRAKQVIYDDNKEPSQITLD